MQETDSTILVSDELKDKLDLEELQKSAANAVASDATIALLVCDLNNDSSIYGVLKGMQVVVGDCLEVELLTNVADAIAFVDRVARGHQIDTKLELHKGEDITYVTGDFARIKKCSMTDIDQLRDVCYVFVQLALS